MSIFRCMVLTAFSFVFAGQLFAQNLITNGGFESGGTGWNLQLQTNFLGTVTYPTTGAPEGTTYAHVNVTQAPGTNPDSINWMAQLQFPQWTAVKNAIYTLSFKAKSSATAMKVGLNRGAPSYAYVNGFAFTLTTSWQTYSCMFTDTASGNGALLLNFNVGAAVGTYDFDSVNLVQTGTNVPTNSLISNGGFETGGSGWGLYVQTENRRGGHGIVSVDRRGRRDHVRQRQCYLHRDGEPKRDTSAIAIAALYRGFERPVYPQL